MIMKKYIIFGLSAALVFSTTSCDQNLLNIQQKGVIAYEDFYQTDDDAKSALTAVYAEFINTFSNSGGVNNPSWNVVSNACGDELYWGGGKKNGSSEGLRTSGATSSMWSMDSMWFSICVCILTKSALRRVNCRSSR